ncbi:LysR family transcriptional regulator [Clostridium magnum]|uniref:HTH-type transcriptional activator CmpR n=1 Tax=Clostridium magnum DSM 2767 TaxID=1121326 RepID=A0A161X572_9CLOT|nr:LysR family transcriptional regulator [Clostridium magnum]KZL89116.1 HTH-type transcriptional activator CmpR [Clostridium magnum DSM 2767]SHI03162.1 transcriptional regulator, LysR family [Clostridium magnum DSM 2767]
MDVKQLQTFIVLARLLNFRAAAEELNYSQSTVSDHIRNLEQELGVKLFERIGKKVFLNEEGNKLISPAQKMLQDAEEIHELFNKGEKVHGDLRIGAAETLCAFWLPPLLKEYTKIYPKVRIILKMADCLEFHELLEKNIVDVAFSLHDESKRKDLFQIDIFDDSTVFVASPDHPFSTFKKIAMDELENQSFILVESESGYTMELKKLFKKLNVQVDAIMELGSIEAIKQCVKEGLGISFLPRIAVDKEIKNGELVILPVETDNILIHAKMVYHVNKWMSSPMEALKELVLLKKNTKSSMQKK